MTHLAITLIRHRLQTAYGNAISATYTVKGEPTKQIIFSVKAGKVDVSQVRDLPGVIAREQARLRTRPRYPS
jgi:hypothetical protein